jgi:hypothetical protein
MTAGGTWLFSRRLSRVLCFRGTGSGTLPELAGRRLRYKGRLERFTLWRVAFSLPRVSGKSTVKPVFGVARETTAPEVRVWFNQSVFGRN